VVVAWSAVGIKTVELTAATRIKLLTLKTKIPPSEGTEEALPLTWGVVGPWLTTKNLILSQLEEVLATEAA
jgi:hypothetical protein